MSFGLNKILKKTFPKGLFYRSLIIVAAPTIILQIIITIVFFDSIWIKANKGLTRSLVAEIKTLYDVYNNQDTNFTNFITTKYKKILISWLTLKTNSCLRLVQSENIVLWIDLLEEN